MTSYCFVSVLSIKRAAKKREKEENDYDPVDPSPESMLPAVMELVGLPFKPFGANCLL